MNRFINLLDSLTLFFSCFFFILEKPKTLEYARKDDPNNICDWVIRTFCFPESSSLCFTFKIRTLFEKFYHLRGHILLIIYIRTIIPIISKLDV